MFDVTVFIFSHEAFMQHQRLRISTCSRISPRLYKLVFCTALEQQEHAGGGTAQFEIDD